MNYLPMQLLSSAYNIHLQYFVHIRATWVKSLNFDPLNKTNPSPFTVYCFAFLYLYIIYGTIFNGTSTRMCYVYL